jgi:ribonuclease G
MNRELIINAGKKAARIALMEDRKLAELVIEHADNRSCVGNVYKGRVDNVVPGIQAAFVDVGMPKNGFLYVTDVTDGLARYEEELEEHVVDARKRRSRSTSIAKVLKEGQDVLVQVTKEPIGTKGTRLTTFVSLPGRFVVLMPNVSHVGVSRKIAGDSERTRLKKLATQLKARGMGIIVRTAAEGVGKRALRADIDVLVKQWRTIRRRMRSRTAPALLHEDAGPVSRIVRDLFTRDIRKLTIDSEAEYSKIVSFCRSFDPELKRRVRLYRGRRPLFEKLNLEQEIEKLLRRKVWLKSGGYILIEQTEAFGVIDVNTGKFTGKTSLEETVFKTNVEAAGEIARQVRLRDMGGIIVIDFIDMESPRRRAEVLRVLTEAVRNDRSKPAIFEVTELGLVEMTRKRARQNLMSTLSETCPYCEGAGRTKSATTVSLEVLYRLESLFASTREKSVVVEVHPRVAERLQSTDKDALDEITKSFKRDVRVRPKPDFHIEKMRFRSSRTGRMLKHSRP